MLAATAGGPAHYLALDTGMRSLVASLDGWTVPTVTYATPADFDEQKVPSENVRVSLAEALAEAPVGPAMSPPSVDEFAAGAAEWLAAHRAEAPPDYGAICPPEQAEAGRRWQRLLFDAGYAGIHWPVEHGGQGLTPEHQAAWLIECAKASVPPVLNMVGLVLAGGAILHVRHARAAGPAPAARRCAASRCGASCSRSPAPAATSAGCRRRPSATATTSSSTARRCGARAAGSATGAS